MAVVVWVGVVVAAVVAVAVRVEGMDAVGVDSWDEVAGGVDVALILLPKLHANVARMRKSESKYLILRKAFSFLVNDEPRRVWWLRSISPTAHADEQDCRPEQSKER